MFDSISPTHRAPSLCQSARCRLRRCGWCSAALTLSALVGGCNSTTIRQAEVPITAAPTPRPLPPREQRRAAASLATWWNEFNRRRDQYNRKSAPSVQPQRAPSMSWFGNTPNHPALQLAATLQDRSRSLIGPNLDDSAGAIVAAGTIAAPGFIAAPREWAESSFAGRGQSTLMAVSPTLQSLLRVLDGRVGSETVLATGLPPLRAQARERQWAALQLFLRDVNAEQNAAREGERTTLLAAMNDDIVRARSLSLDAIAPELPDDPLVLELTNLRLTLLNDLYRNQAERVQARARLIELETQWREILRRQENERRALLVRLRDERPRTIEEQQRRFIATTLQSTQSRDTKLRSDLADEQRARIAADFRPAARLGIVLPAGSALAKPVGSRLGATGFATNNTSLSSNRTAERRTASASPIVGAFRIEAVPELPSVARGSDGFGSAMARLRTVGRNDHAVWAKIVAQREAAWYKATFTPPPVKTVPLQAGASQ